MLTLFATVVNVFPTNEFKDEKSGEITPAGFKAQFQYKELVKGKNGQPDGEKFVLKDFNIRTLNDQYSKCIGKVVSVPVGIYLSEQTRKPELFLPAGSLPTVQQLPK